MIYKSFNGLPRLVQIILLLVPVVNWVVELLVRWSNWAHRRGILRLLLALLVTIFGVVWGWIDCIWVLLFKHLILAK